MRFGRRWSVQDGQGNPVYLTEERWEHIVEGHPEMVEHEHQLREAVRLGVRTQDSLNPQKFRYLRAFPSVWGDNTHLEAVVLFRFEEEEGRLIANNYVVTAYLKEIGWTMSEAQIRYDEPSDTLYVSFAPGEAATGLELSDHILLRVDGRSRSAIGITLFDFSLLAQQTDLGPRSFPLSGLARLSPELRELAVSLLQSEPVSDYLSLSAFSPSANETIPITVLRPGMTAPRAA